MSREVLINSTRGATHIPVLANEPVMIEEKTIIVASGAGGAIPYNTITLYSRRGVPDIKQGDQITETVSGQQYRVSGTVKVYDSSFLMVDITRFMDNTP